MRDSREDIALQMLGMEIGLARLSASISEALPRSGEASLARHAAVAGRLGRSLPYHTRLRQRLIRTGP